MGIRSLGSSIKSDANGLVGNIAKAVLIFPDYTLKIKKITLEKTKKKVKVNQYVPTTTDSAINERYEEGKLTGIDNMQLRN